MPDPSHAERRAHCGKYPPLGRRLTLPRAVRGDLLFCDLGCFSRWQASQPSSVSDR